MVFFDSGPSKKDDDESAIFACSYLSPSIWRKKGGYELSNSIEEGADEEVDERDDADAEAIEDSVHESWLHLVHDEDKGAQDNSVNEEEEAADEAEEKMEEEEPDKDFNEKLAQPHSDKNASGKSLRELSKSKPQMPKPSSMEAISDDDIDDDESETSIEVLIRYMGCTKEKYLSIGGTMTDMDSLYTDHDSDLIDNIDTIETTDENINSIEAGSDREDSKESEEVHTESNDTVENSSVEEMNKEQPFADYFRRLTAEGTNTINTATDEEDEKSRAVKVEEKCNEEQTSTSEVQTVQVFNRLTVDNTAAVSEVPQIKSIDSVTSPLRTGTLSPKKIALSQTVSRMSSDAFSPSVRQMALRLQNAPKYPTTDYTVLLTEPSPSSITETVRSNDEKNDKEAEIKGASAENQGEKQGPTRPLSKLEEMDEIIKSTRAWLQTQKAERKVIDNITVQSTSPKNSRDISLLKETKNVNTFLPQADAVLSSGKALSTRTLDRSLLSRKETLSDGPKKSVLEQIELIRARQREREKLDSLLLSQKATLSDSPKKSVLEQIEEVRARQRERERLRNSLLESDELKKTNV
jgi:hypothetical protein